MKRLVVVLAATAAAAAVAAAITLPAGADPLTPADAKFVTCLRSQGLAIPAGTRGDDIKAWLLAQRDQAAVDRAVSTCKPRVADGPGPQELIACLRKQGLDPPSDLDQFKPWLAQTMATPQGEAAARACKLEMAPKDKAGGPAPCGAPPAPESKQPEEAPELQQ
jgi:hypothetical protein